MGGKSSTFNRAVSVSGDLTNKISGEVDKESTKRSSSLHNLKNKHSENPVITNPILLEVCQILVQKSAKFNVLDGISQEIFLKYFSLSNCDFSARFYALYSEHSSHKLASGAPISSNTFFFVSNEILHIYSSSEQRKFCFKLFAPLSSKNLMPRKNLIELLHSSLSAAIDLTTAKGEPRQQCCFQLVDSLANSCMHGESEISIDSFSHWVKKQSPHLLSPLLCWIDHKLTDLESATHLDSAVDDTPVIRPSSSLNDLLNVSPSVNDLCRNNNSKFGFYLGVQGDGMHRSASADKLDEPNSPTGTDRIFHRSKSSSPASASPILIVEPVHLKDLSITWILACSLPALYNEPNQQKKPTLDRMLSVDQFQPATFMARLLTSYSKDHCHLLYDNCTDGSGINRFQHHVFKYRGPTLTFIKGDQNTLFCVALDQEWRESTIKWGGEMSAAIQLTPEFKILESGSKLAFYNTSTRGVSFGFQMGSNSKSPVLEFDPDMSILQTKKVPFQIQKLEVWGCAGQTTKAAQTKQKRWEFKQAEKERKVDLKKIDWRDHPDRFLIELAGRPNYANYVGHSKASRNE